ncbi:hypothetical protein BDB00DRAFT_830683 [Zychaea mexicana]|uniref:uncharacterized protein n=1 Tax=Zychaea mexicana TaxID=64656 RepID=UPI0022FDC458|nr:uncharacterized protein BDB00DRAFT_830683 [Zychaea mexicana]KAI9491994.1 hypothetical protein BDB00DRAFT_830683 [Zychaea mexicana]
MSHFRCPNSTLMSAAGYYSYHQGNSAVEDDNDRDSSTMLLEEQLPRSSSSSSSTRPTIINASTLRNSRLSSTTTPTRNSSSSSSTNSNSSSSNGLRHGGYIHDEEDDDNGSVLSASSASSSSSSTILAPRPAASTREPTSTSARPASSSSRQQRSTAVQQQQQQRRNQLLAAQQQQQQRQSQQQSNDEGRRCWICFGEDADSEGNWVKPCKCSLVSHEKCLLDWITENQKGSPLKKVHCPQCNTPYHLSEHRSLPLALLTLVDSLVHTAAPYLTFLGLGCSMLITSTTYGAYTVLTLFGAREGERLIGSPVAWTWRTWLGLPSIPAALILSRSRWADGVLPFAAMLLLRATSTHPNSPVQVSWPPSPTVTVGALPWVRLLYNNLYLLAQHQLSRKLLHLRRGQQEQQPQTRRQQQQQQQNNTTATARQAPNATQMYRDELERHGAEILGDPTWDERRRRDQERDDQTAEAEREADALLNIRERGDLGVTVIGALLWPTISSIVGSCLNHFKLVRQYFPEPYHRSFLGGCLFVVAKDMASLFYKYEKIRQRQSRRVLNYDSRK